MSSTFRCKVRRLERIRTAWPEPAARENLLRLLLLLLADADLELLLLRFLVCFPIEPLAGFGEILIDIDIFREHGHQGGGQRAVGAGDAITLDVRNCHDFLRLT